MKKIISLIVCGLSLGWFVGLSVSPNVQYIISGFTTLLISIVTILSGIDFKNKEENSLKNLNFDLVPIAVLLFFLAVGGTIGIYVKTHNLLGVEQVASTPATPKVETPKNTIATKDGVFNAYKTDICHELCNMSNRTIVTNILENSRLLTPKELNSLKGKDDSYFFDFVKNKTCNCP